PPPLVSLRMRTETFFFAKFAGRLETCTEKLVHSFFAPVSVMGRSVGTGSSGLFKLTPWTCAPEIVGLSFFSPIGRFTSGSFTVAQPVTVRAMPIKKRVSERQGAKAPR